VGNDVGMTSPGDGIGVTTIFEETIPEEKMNLAFSARGREGGTRETGREVVSGKVIVGEEMFDGVDVMLGTLTISGTGSRSTTPFK